MEALPSAPLADWRFTGTLRTYQAEVLARVPAGAESLHIVAPPGSGKTLLGLLLAAREGHRTLVLAPTTTIREQWVRTAADLAPGAAASSISDDPARIADVTALTYQLLGVTGDGSPFEALARAIWIDELAESGRTDAAASTWLAELEADNGAEYRSGIRTRVRRLRRRFARQRPDQLARVLHPNAVATMDAIVAAGVQTIVLDECHHLLDHWALVVAYLRARIREHGGAGTVIGLTATLPSPDDDMEFENYSQLLGAVDYEVPTPAVVKEGHLAPYRDHVLFVEPTTTEARFIRHHEALLHDLMMQVLSSPEGLDFLVTQLQPAVGEEAAGEEMNHLRRFEEALSEDFPFTRSCVAVLREIAPAHPLVALVPDVLLDRATTEDALLVITRFAQTRLLQDSSAKKQWEYVKGALADFGYLLTDRGIRRGRNPVETALAYSAAKDDAAVQILHRELAGPDGPRVRAVIVTDFVAHGNHRGDLGAEPAGAIRAFARVAADPATGALRPVLLTAQQVRTRSADGAQLAAALGALLGDAVAIADDDGETCALRVRMSGAVVTAISELIRRGEVRLLVGTRALLGEGWDCPAVNTLIDLTSVATSQATQQLRGRTLRLDPDWKEKVAHNWSVACLIPSDVDLDDQAEPQRLRRKHSHLWGLDADGTGQIVNGLGHALPAPAQDALRRVLAKDEEVTIARINELAPLPARAHTRAEWRIGAPYASREREVVTVRRRSSAPLLRAAPTLHASGGGAFLLGSTGMAVSVGVATEMGLSVPPGAGAAAIVAAGIVALGATTVPAFGRMLRDRAHPDRVYRAAAIAVARTLHEAGRVQAIDEQALTAHVDAARSDRIRIELGGHPAERTLVAEALEELFGPVENPRFLLHLDRRGQGRLARLADRLSPGRTLLAVPRAIARRRATAERFAVHWRELIGPCALHELRGAEGLALLRVARSIGSHLDAAEPRARLWG